MKSIRLQILAGFAFLTIALCIVGGYGAYVGRTIGTSMLYIADDLSPLAERAATISTVSQKLFGATLLYTTTTAEAEEARVKIGADIQSLIAELTELTDSTINKAKNLNIDVGDTEPFKAVMADTIQTANSLQQLHDTRLAQQADASQRQTRYSYDIEFVDFDTKRVPEALQERKQSIIALRALPFAALIARTTRSLTAVTLETNLLEYEKFVEALQITIEQIQTQSEPFVTALESDGRLIEKYVKILNATVGESGHVTAHLEYLKTTELINQGLGHFDADNQELKALILENLVNPIRFAKTQSTETANHFVTNSFVLNLSLIGVSIVLACGISYYIFSIVHRCIHGITSTLEQLTQGNLNARAAELPTTEFSKAGRSINVLAQELHNTIQIVVDSVSMLKESASRANSVSTANYDAVSEQEQHSQSVAAAVTQMEAAVNEVAVNANQANAMVSSLTESAGQHMNTMAETLNQMSDLKHSIDQSGNVISSLFDQTKQVSEILSIIESISEQTNLLALNAAIEAARAGEQGRGFAVVADEVRTLASRTSSSAQEIREALTVLEKESTAVVESSTQNIARADKTMARTSEARDGMQSIIDELQNVADASTTIATATEEQSSVSKEVASSIVTITEQTTKISENSRLAAENSKKLTSLSDDLTTHIAKFQI